jgi:tetratricopeptide (TPR) repeat protein
MDRGDNYQAISELQPALDRSNDAEQRALLLDLIGLCHAEEDEFAEALEFYEQALQEKPDDHVALVNMGIVYRLTDRFDKADECYRAALEIQPDYAELHASIGSLRIHQNRLADAALHLENALRLDDSLAVAHANLALAYARLGRREEADAELAKAMDRGYANGEALRGLMGRS